MKHKIIPLLAYAVSIFFSNRYADGYWVVGPVFAAAFFVINHEKVFKNPSLKHLAFLLASTLVYALVYWISGHGWKLEPEWLDMLAGATTVGIIIGSLLMSLVHALIFGVDLKKVRLVAGWLIGSWYFVLLLSWIDDATGFKPSIDYLLVSLALWQGIYLKCLKPN